MQNAYKDQAEFLVVYIREAHPTDSNWADLTLEIHDPVSDIERRSVANQCAAALDLDVPMVVDGVDDAVNMAYSAWPERIYVLKPDGEILYRGGLGPMGFKVAEASAALATFLGIEEPEQPEPADEKPDPDCVDDGFSGLWTGIARGRVTPGTLPCRLHVALGSDGTVGGRVEVGKERANCPLLEAKYDVEGGLLTGKVLLWGQRMVLKGKVTEQSILAHVAANNGMGIFQFKVRRVRKGASLVPGPEDPMGTWVGSATATDRALQGTVVKLALQEVGPKKVVGTVTLGDVTGTITRGTYDGKTGAFTCLAHVTNRTAMHVHAVLTPTSATGCISMDPALEVTFEVKRETEPADAE